MSRDGTGLGVVLCGCGGTLYDEADGKRLAAGIAGGADGAPLLLHHSGACAAEALDALGAELARGGIGRVLFAGCSLLERPDLAVGLARAAGLTPSAVRGVNLREPVFWRLSGEEALRRGAAEVQRALRALALQPAFGTRRVALHPAVLVVGEGPAAEEAERQARALGHETRRVPAVAALEGQVGSFSARLPGRGLPEGAGAAAETVTAGAVIFAGAAAPAALPPGALPAGAPALPAEPSAVPLAGLPAAAAALPRRRAPRSIGILLDHGPAGPPAAAGSRAAMEQALQAALLLQERGRVQVRLLCREARVAALSLGALYDRAREAGVEIVRYAGTPAFGPAGEGAAGAGPGPVEVSLQDAVLGSPVRLSFDLLAVAPPGPAAASLPPATLLGPAGPRLQEGNVHLLPNGTCRPGVFAAGPARGEDWPPLALQEARAAALAAHALLAPGFLEVELSHPTVDAERCALCLTCVRSCPFGAMRVDAEGKAAESRPEVCQRCGICAAECPARAIELPACSGPMLETQLGTGAGSR